MHAMPVPLPPSTVSAMVVDAVRLPEVPVTVTVDVLAAAVLPAVSVSTLVPVVGLVPKAAVTPAGNVDAASVTLPVNPLRSVTAMVSVPLELGAIERDVAEGAIVKLGAAVTISEKVVVAVSVPEVQVMVMAYVPGAVVLLAVSVSTLVVVIGLVPNAEVTPIGKPDIEQVTLPEKGLTSVTVMVSVPLAP